MGAIYGETNDDDDLGGGGDDVTSISGVAEYVLGSAVMGTFQLLMYRQRTEAGYAMPAERS